MAFACKGRLFQRQGSVSLQSLAILSSLFAPSCFVSLLVFVSINRRRLETCHRFGSGRRWLARPQCKRRLQCKRTPTGKNST